MQSEPVSGYVDCYYSRTIAGVYTPGPSLDGAHTADVCVIGGGLAGVSTALALAQRGKSVVLLEARRMGWGASGRNGGFVAKGYAADHAALRDRLGLAHAQGLVSLTTEARRLIKKRIGEFNIECGPIIHGVLTVSVHDRDQPMRDEIRRANDEFDLGLEFWPTEKVREHCKTERYFQGSFSPQDFQFHPLRYLIGIAHAATARGARIFESSPAQKIEPDGNGWIIRTAAGTVRAAHVVNCTSVYAAGLDRRVENAVFPVQTYVTVTKPLDEDILRGAINTRHPIYDMRWACDYYRVLDDRRVLWGGRVGLWAEPHDIARAQIADMIRVYPQLAGYVEADLAWSGLMCYAPHKMPLIGQAAPGYWYNTGFGGHGLVPTTVGGEVVAGAIVDGDTRIDLFRPFAPHYAGGRAGRYAAQMIYWLWRARDYVRI